MSVNHRLTWDVRSDRDLVAEHDQPFLLALVQRVAGGQVSDAERDRFIHQRAERLRRR